MKMVWLHTLMMSLSLALSKMIARWLTQDLRPVNFTGEPFGTVGNFLFWQFPGCFIFSSHLTSCPTRDALCETCSQKMLEKAIIPLRNNCALSLSASNFWCSLGYGIPGVHAVHDTELVHGLDAEPQPEVSDQTSAVGADSSLYGSCCKRSHHSGMLVYLKIIQKVSCFFNIFIF